MRIDSDPLGTKADSMASERRHDPVWRRALATLICCAAFITLGFVAFKVLESLDEEPERSESRAALPVVEVLRVQRGDYVERAQGYGRARPLRDSRVSAEITAVIKAVSPRLEAGEGVSAGDELVTLDDVDFKEALSRSRARVRQAEADLARDEATIKSLVRRLAIGRGEFAASKRELERIQKMLAGGAASANDLDLQLRTSAVLERNVVKLESDLDIAKLAVDAATAAKDSAEVDVRIAARDLSRCVVRAPFEGVIESRTAQLGERVAPGTELFRMMDRSRIEIPVAIGASHYGQVRVGGLSSLVDPRDETRSWRAKIARISSSIDARRRTFFAFLVVEGGTAGSPPPPGAFLKATVEARHFEDVFVIPRRAFLGAALFVAVPEDGRDEAVAHRREVELERLLPDVAIVRTGLEPDEAVIITNLESIANGARIRLLEDADDAPSNGASDR